MNGNGKPSAKPPLFPLDFTRKISWPAIIASLAIFAGVAVYAKNVQRLDYPGIVLILGIAYGAMAGGFLTGMICTALMTVMMTLCLLLPRLGVPVTSSAARLPLFFLFGTATSFTFATLIERVRRAEAKLASDERAIFRQILANLHDAVLECDWRGIRDVNPSFCALTGFSREELIGHAPPFPFWPQEEYARLATALEQAMRGQAHDFELVLLRKGGERFPVLLSVSHFDGGDKSSARTVYTIRDITDLKRVQQSLAVSESRLEEAVNTAQLGIWEWDAIADKVHENPHARNMFGLPADSPDETMAEFFKRVHPDDWARMQAEQEKNIRATGGFAYRFRILREDGAVATIQGRGHCTCDETGKLIRMSGVCFVVQPAG